MHHGQTLSRRRLGGDQLVAPGVDQLRGSSAVASLAGETVVTGKLREISLRPGLSLYCSDICDQQDLDVSSPLAPGLLLVMTLSGEADVSYGSRRFRLGPQRESGDRLRHDGLAVTLTRPDDFTRRLRIGARRRVVSLAMTPQWLDECQSGLSADPGIDALRKTHLATHRWRLSPRLLALAGDILETQAPLGPLQGLHLESRCLEIAAEALTAITGETPTEGPGLRPRERRRLAALREFLDSGEADGLSLDALAQRIGMSASTLQRSFRIYSGMSVFEYLRYSRLSVARTALECEGISVGEAAHLAGYTSAANFTTAFRRRFGVTPGQLRQRS